VHHFSIAEKKHLKAIRQDRKKEAVKELEGRRRDEMEIKYQSTQFELQFGLLCANEIMWSAGAVKKTPCLASRNIHEGVFVKTTKSP
jgi:hypothetical protein